MFKRKRRGFNAEAKAVLIEATSTIMLAAHAITDIRLIEDDSGSVNRPALGYIFGFVQAGIAHLGGDPLDAFVGVPVMLEILERFYPGRADRYLDLIMRTWKRTRR